jgi:xylan 1,4-beta-xylosidase
LEAGDHWTCVTWAAADFLRQFLEHCARGTNHLTKRRARLDFITFHAKGRPEVTEGTSGWD